VLLTAGCATPLGDDELVDLGIGREGGASRLQDSLLVTCHLQGRVRRVGNMTYQAPRRVEMLTQRECGARGGDYVLFDRSDYASALQSLLPDARAGDALAQTYVGEIYEKGLGLPAPDPAEAAVWYRKAAAQGNVAAQVALGSLYERGFGVSADKSEALNWYRKASGIADDPLEFRSTFEAERAALKQELAKRRQIAADLRRRVNDQQARAQLLAQKREAASRAAQLKARARAASAARMATAQLAAQAPLPEQEQLQAKVQRLERLELALKSSSDDFSALESSLVESS
jgi:hypothetical protein